MSSLIAPFCEAQDKEVSPQTEYQARQLVLQKRYISPASYLYTWYEELVALGLAVMKEHNLFYPTEALIKRDQELKAKRFTIDELAAKMGKTPPTKATIVKRNMPASIRGKGSIETLLEFLEDAKKGDPYAKENAIEYAQLAGFGYLFGQVNRGVPEFYFDLKNEEYDGVMFVSCRNTQGHWYVMHAPTGLAISDCHHTHKTRNAARDSVETNLEKLRASGRTLAEAIARNELVDQENLKQLYLTGTTTQKEKTA